ncbi:MAG: hypothetical protein HQL38_08880 [Alphaproteobacteria bacterium]|nr:hypothetical protein [Alphaproteobacteria bacterium]
MTLNKGTPRQEFEEAIRRIAALPLEQRRRVRPVAYVFVKPPWLAEAEAITDCIKTMEYIHALSSSTGIGIVPKLEPAIISEGTLLSVLWRDKRYQPLSYRAILEILVRIDRHQLCSDLIQKIRIGTRGDMDESAKIPAVYRPDGRFDQYDFTVYGGIQQFNQHHNLAAVFGLFQAVYRARGEDILDRNQSLLPWARSTFKSMSECAILRYISDNRDAINTASAGSAISREARYVGKLFKFLDIVEGHKDGGSRLRINAPNWWGNLHDHNREMAGARNEIEAEIRELFSTQLSYSDVSLLDAYAEDGDSRFIRVKLEISDLLQRQVYEIYAAIPS